MKFSRSVFLECSLCGSVPRVARRHKDCGNLDGILPPVSQQPASIEILGVRYARLSADEALARAEVLYERDEPAWIAVENAHGLNLAYSDPSFRAVLRRAELVLNDGKGVMLAALLNGRPFPADLNGNFFTPRLLARAASRGWPTYLLGADPGVAERAARRLQASLPQLTIAGVRHGFVAPDEEAEVCEKIRASGAGLLLVGMGNPLQERWLDRNLARSGARLGLGVGAFFDFQAGKVPRAPGWMNRLGIEWVHRLAQEPGRLWRRYLFGNPLFIYRVVRERLRRGRERVAPPR
jgi:exopolysaccharide biosynthesis WecB/TagA/CpsF family protein